MRRPELGALAGLILVTIFFLSTADASMFTLAGIMNVLTPASQLGILAIAAALLMIGGEFDLSIGSMVAFAGLIFGAFLILTGWPLLLAIAATFAVAALLGGAQRPDRHPHPAALLHRHAGIPVHPARPLAGRAEMGDRRLDADARHRRAGGRGLRARDLFGRRPRGSVRLARRARHHRQVPERHADGHRRSGLDRLVHPLRRSLATWLLLRTQAGNWIFAAGGDANAARNSGVPVDRVKTGLFMLTACAAALVAILTVLDAGSTDARRGFQKEFEAIIAAVIGGCLLTGGYGSAIGAFFGAIIFGMVSIGLTYTRFDSDWFQVFLGAMLLLAVLFNNYIRKKVTGER